MRRETKPCPFYGMPCEYVPMAEKADAAADEIERLRAALQQIVWSNDSKWQSDCARAALGEKE